MSKAESALVILVPEAEPLVRPFRDRFDPSAALGVPAHITLLYPFIPPSGSARTPSMLSPHAFAASSRSRFP